MKKSPNEYGLCVHCIAVYANPGQTLYDCIRQSIAMAADLDTMVEVTFNEKTYQVIPGAIAQSIIDKADRTLYIGSKNKNG